jgi:hypothetical protein
MRDTTGTHPSLQATEAWPARLELAPLFQHIIGRIRLGFVSLARRTSLVRDPFSPEQNRE